MKVGRLAGEVAVITGSTGGGLGTEMARVFAAEGAAVVVTGRDETRGRVVVESIDALGGAAVFARADLGDPSAATAVVRVATARFGRITVLVNNAVAMNQRLDGPIAEVPLEVWDEAFRVNVHALLHMCRAALPAMGASGGGAVVNIGSRTAIRGTPNLSAYTATKGAVHALTRSIAVDYAARGIRCNTVSPGYIVGKDRDGQLDADLLASVQAMHLTLPPTTTEVSLAALYLASRESRSITGCELLIDGGGSMARGATIG